MKLHTIIILASIGLLSAQEQGSIELVDPDTAEVPEVRDYVSDQQILSHYLNRKDGPLPDLEVGSCVVKFSKWWHGDGDSWYDSIDIEQTCQGNTRWRKLYASGPDPSTLTLRYCKEKGDCAEDQTTKSAQVLNGPETVEFDADGNAWVTQPIRTYGVWRRTSGAEGFCTIGEHSMSWTTTFDECYLDGEITSLRKPGMEEVCLR